MSGRRRHLHPTAVDALAPTATQGFIYTSARMTDPLRPWVSISSGELSAEIDPRGAQLSVLRTRGAADLLWNGDPSVWSGRAPLLFPIIGVLAGGSYRLGDARYPLSRHGFARDKTFSLESSSASAVSFMLQADASTLALYPFQFELQVR